jgi:multidrug efflux system outer membrane protein
LRLFNEKGPEVKTNTLMRPVAVGLISAILPAGLIGGCTLGPDYKRPQVTTPSAFRAQVTPQQAASFADVPWWSAFDDPVLQGLISEAVANNYDVKIAVARIEQARAQVGVVHSDILPQLNYGATAGAGRVPVQGLRSVNAVTVGTVAGAIDFAWEMDVWGRIRRSTEAAEADLLAQEDIRRGVLLTLVTDVATGYFRLLQLDRQLAIAEDSSRVFGKTYDFFNTRFQGGRDSELPVQRAKANVEASNARVEQLRRQIGQQEDALSILLGGYPKDIPRGRDLLQQTVPATPVGATTDLLQRRPDILAAEQNMVSANAQIGVAVANFFPRIGLSALGGIDWFRVAGVNHNFGIWNAALSATGPIFNGGRLHSIYEGRKAFWDETVAQYQKTVLTAFRETSDALIAQQTLATERGPLEAQVAALQRSSDLASTRYDNGRASYFEVLEAQQQLFPAEDALAQNQGDQLVAVVSLYRALGGGWQFAPEQWSHPTAAAAPAGVGTGAGVGG